MSSVAAIQRGPSTVRQEESKERSNASPVRLTTAMGSRYGPPCQLDTRPNWQRQGHPQACAYGYEFQIAHGRTYPVRAAATTWRSASRGRSRLIPSRSPIPLRNDESQAWLVCLTNIWPRARRVSLQCSGMDPGSAAVIGCSAAPVLEAHARPRHTPPSSPGREPARRRPRCWPRAGLPQRPR